MKPIKDWPERAECDFGYRGLEKSQTLKKEEKHVTTTGKQNVQAISVSVGSGDGKEA